MFLCGKLKQIKHFSFNFAFVNKNTQFIFIVIVKIKSVHEETPLKLLKTNSCFRDSQSETKLSENSTGALPAQGTYWGSGGEYP